MPDTEHSPAAMQVPATEAQAYMENAEMTNDTEAALRARIYELEEVVRRLKPGREAMIAFNEINPSDDAGWVILCTAGDMRALHKLSLPEPITCGQPGECETTAMTP